ncbi:outer membrane protein [Kiloniella sp. b19]|uniref:outer membrane protein n=1 Tax=Kiloniella sp. GXU_MW_B19 TaxID=3141326 RepID=UPI0031D10D68
MFNSSVSRSRLFRSTVFGLAGLLSMAGTAQAGGHEKGEHADQFYLSVFGGASFAQDLDYDGQVGGNPQTVDTDLDNDFVFGGAIGYDFNSVQYGVFSPRLELELSYREHDTDGINFSGNGAGPDNDLGGDIGLTTLLTNAYLDITAFEEHSITPFVGVGLGVAFIDQNVVYAPNAATTPVIDLGDSDEVFAAQFIAGVDYAFTDHISLYSDVRYLVTDEFESDRINQTAGVNTGNLEERFSSTSINIGLRYSF